MDLNYLYHRHQVSLYQSENADCERARLAHAALADGYAAKIEKAKRLQLELHLAEQGAAPLSRQLVGQQ